MKISLYKRKNRSSKGSARSYPPKRQAKKGSLKRSFSIEEQPHKQTITVTLYMKSIRL